MNKSSWLGISAAILMGTIFVYAGMGKLLLKSDNLPFILTGELGQSLFVVLPYIEITIGLLLILGVAVKVVAGFSGLMIAGFIVNNIILLNLGMGNEPCGCLGDLVGSLPVWGALFLDLVMVALVIMIFRFYPCDAKRVKPLYLKTASLKGAG